MNWWRHCIRKKVKFLDIDESKEEIAHINHSPLFVVIYPINSSNVLKHFSLIAIIKYNHMHIECQIQCNMSSNPLISTIVKHLVDGQSHNLTFLQAFMVSPYLMSCSFGNESKIYNSSRYTKMATRRGEPCKNKIKIN